MGNNEAELFGTAENGEHSGRCFVLHFMEFITMVVMLVDVGKRWQF